MHFNATITHGFGIPARAIRVLFTLMVPFFGGMRAMAQVPNIQIEQPAGTPKPDNGTVAYNLVSVGDSATRTFTIKNTGAGTLSNFGISKTGANAGAFAYSSPGANSLGPGATTTFDVTFYPSQMAYHEAFIHISSNAPLENPYDIKLTGTGTGPAAPEISVYQGASTLTDGNSTVNFGNVDIGITATRTIKVKNTGTGSLSGLSASISGGAAFQTSPIVDTSLAGEEDTEFTVSFTPTSEVESTASLLISSNDDDENPFNITIRGTGFRPLMEVHQPEGTPLTDGFSTIDFGTRDPGDPNTLTFTLRNVSIGSLTGLALRKTGSHASDFVIGALSSTTLATGTSMTFTVSFNPSNAGDRTAVIHVLSDQSVAPSFAFNVKGVGTALSEWGDADSDGTANLLEQATTGDPLTPGPPPGDIAMNGTTLEFTFKKSVAYLFVVEYIVEWTDDLALPWNATPFENSSILSNDGIVQEVKYTMPASASGQRFMRLRVSK